MNILEQPDANTLVFELIHIDVSLANALRRILLAEIPTVAFEKIYLYQNTGLIHDEVLAHRLGLIPLHVDARLLDDLDESLPTEEQLTDRNVVVFSLNVECKKPSKKQQKLDAEAAASVPMDIDTKDDDDDNDNNNDDDDAPPIKPRPFAVPKPPLYTQSVYSGDLVWMPQGDQATFLADACKVLHDDILLAKLRPGQSISLEAHAIKGTGHAKFSPVATASYRLATRIVLHHDIWDDAAEQLVHVYEPGVFSLTTTPDGRKKAVVSNPYACTMSRNYMRHPVLKEAIELQRVPDHFIFSVESLGAYPPAVLVAEALQILHQKCIKLQGLVDDVVNAPTGTSS